MNLTSNIRFQAEASYALGSIYTFEEDYLKSKNYFQQTISVDPKFEAGYIGLARVQFLMAFDEEKTVDESTNLIADSFNNLIYAIDLNPEKTLVYYQLGTQYKIMEIEGNAEKAKLMFEKALEVVKNDITLSVHEKDEMREMINLEMAELISN